MQIEELIHNLEEESILRNMEVSFKPLLIGIDVPDEIKVLEKIPNSELNQLIVDFLNSNQPLLLENLHISLLPERSLTSAAAYVGRLVQNLKTGDIGVITNINRQLVKIPLTVVYKDGRTEKGHFVNYSVINEFPSDIVEDFKYLTPANEKELKNGGIYRLNYLIDEDLIVLKINKTTQRATLTPLSIAKKRKSIKMSTSDVMTFLCSAE